MFAVGQATPSLEVGAGGRVGIDTAATIGKLEFATPSSEYGLLHTDAGVEVGTFVNGTGGWLGTRSDDPRLLFTNDQSAAITVTTSSSVGTGTTAPAELLSVSGDAGKPGGAHGRCSPTGA